MFPDNTPKEREYYIAKAKGAVCIMQIGDVMESGERHDGRAPDYDDWSLNADIVVYYPVLDIALELSSMAEVSGSPVYVCSSFGKPISARYSVPSGRMILQRKRRAMASIFCKCQASKDRKNTFFK